jgi:glycosyltransferase involved in cell wall biosynthesis
MKRVVFVVNAEEFGGLEIVLLDWLSGIEYSKVSVTVCYRAHSVEQVLAAQKLPVESMQLIFPNGENFWNELRNWRGIYASIKSNKIILMEGQIGDLSLAAILAARLSARDGVFLFAGGSGASVGASAKKNRFHFTFLPRFGLRRYRKMVKQQFRGRLLRRTFVSSRGVKDKLVASFAYPSGRTSVLLHGVDTQRFRASSVERSEFRRSHEIPDNATLIVSHGRMARIKRVDRILKAFEILSASYVNLWLLLTCYGPLKKDIEEEAASSNVCSRIKLVGFQQDVSKLLKAADIYVLASDYEGFGIALIEAMSTGLVCVATNCLGPADILVNQVNGILVDATDEGVLAGLRRALSMSFAERTRVSEQARRTVEERFEIHCAIRNALEALGIPRR